MKWLTIAVMMAAPAGAADFQDLQRLDAAAVAALTPAVGGPARTSVAGGLEHMSEPEWQRFVQLVRERELDDDHLSPQERSEVLTEWIRRNPEDRDKLTGEYNTDYVNIVLGYGRARRSGGAESARAGTLKGRFGAGGAELGFDSRAGRLSGAFCGLPVDLTIDRAASKLTGRVNGAAADLELYSGAGLEGVRGAANGDAVDYTISWERGLAEGSGNRTPFLIMWEPGSFGSAAEVQLSGYVNHAVLELSYDRRSGRLTGEANHGRVDIVLSGWDLRDFIRYYFLFMKPHNFR